MKKAFWTFLTLCIVLWTQGSFAQNQSETWEFYEAQEAWQGSLNIGLNSFWGDIDDGTNKILPTTPFQKSFYKQRNFVLGGFFGKRLTPCWNINIDFKLANVEGRDYKNAKQFISYLNHEITITTTFDILMMAKVYTPWSLYPRIGIGIYGFKSKAWNFTTGELINAYPVRVAPDAAEMPTAPTHYQYALVIPFGIGVGYRVLPELNVFFETSMSWVNTDYLDAYPATNKNFEGVWTSSIGVSYQFDFPKVRHKQHNNGKYEAYDPALKKDNTEEIYKRNQEKSSTVHKRAVSHSKSSIKSKKHKRKKFKMKK